MSVYFALSYYKLCICFIFHYLGVFIGEIIDRMTKKSQGDDESLTPGNKVAFYSSVSASLLVRKATLLLYPYTSHIEVIMCAIIFSNSLK